ncbi:unnamed protein product [Haemonchus placei]|uniref:Actin-interacting protein 1 n=1 Tax=Haemonchus placei TaxID=6290 RepID=A0A0N4WFT1_HAEPC|nr:unnamed protein product [Haemonchus placei]
MNGDESNEYKKIRAFASLPRTVRGFPTVITSSPKGDKIIYCNGNSVFIVDVENITNVDIYTEHPVATTVAKMSPSGFYIASGDSAGNVRIWDTTQSTHILKATYQVFSGSVRDIAWNDDSKRIAAVGEGRERFGHVFLFDTGTSNGNLSGQSRPMSSIDFRPTRPYRLISGSEDNTVAIFEGPPFKFKTTFHEHSRFVHVVLFEGTEGTKTGELIDGSVKTGAAHSGSVFGLAWSPCGKRIATASGDKTVKIWNVPEKTLEKVVTFGDSTEDQQIGISWSPKALVSVSLAGFLSFIDTSGNITKVVQGHNKGITALALSSCKRFLITADFEGHMTRWNVSNGESFRIQPSLHNSQVVGLTVGRDELLMSCAWDDTVRFTHGAVSSNDSIKSTSVKLPSQPQGMATSHEGNSTVIACYKNILVFEGEKLSVDLGVSFNPSCAAIYGDLVAVGGQDSKVHIYSFSGGALREKTVIAHSTPITRVAFSPNGKYLVATDSGRKVVPYSVDDFKTIAQKEWTFHTAKVNCVAWSPDNRHLATGGLDTNIIVWDLERSGEHPIIIRGAHPMSPVNGLAFLSADELLSVGQDANVKHWKINLQ